jgi:hypothetical protein
MNIRGLLLITVLAATAIWGVGGASAATLFTSAAHTTRVTVGASGTATSGTLALTSGSSVIGLCNDASMGFTIAQNSDAGGVIGTVTSASLGACAGGFLSGTPTLTVPWRITVTGTGTTSGGNVSWPAALHNFRYDMLGGTYTGNLTTGVTAVQPVAGAAPVCLTFTNAGTLAGPLYGAGRLDGQYCFTGTSASWSLTN